MKLYVYRKGEKICEIAEKFNTTCQKIIELNNLTNVDFLEDGDVIRVK